MNCLPDAWTILRSEMLVGIRSGEMELLINSRDSGDGYLGQSDISIEANRDASAVYAG
jgi:hypothetical protein